MSEMDTQAPARLVIRRTFDAPRPRVYQAWTRPEQMRRWMGPGDTKVPELESDVRVGGAYHIAMEMADGERLLVRGVYREVREPERLSYTWSWEEDKPEDEVETLVTVEFHDRGSQTDVVLTHERLASEASRDNHERGWDSALDNLVAYLKS